MRFVLFHLIIFLLCFNFILTEYQIEEYPEYRICILPQNYPFPQNAQHSYNFISSLLGLNKNCTHIFGNLKLNHIRDVGLNGEKFDYDFLNSIQEISGTLTIINSEVNRLSFRNLRAIRGESFEKKEFTLGVRNNAPGQSGTEFALEMPSLKLIKNGRVAISFNKNVSFFANRVNWNEIVESSQQIEINNNTVSSSKCHSSCPKWSKDGISKPEAFCFGPKASDCQQRTKCVKNKDYKWCRFIKSPTGTEIEKNCDRECTGGCTGPNAKHCNICRYYNKNNTCVSTCDPVGAYFFGYKRTATKYYNVGSLCTRKCPTSLLYQEKSCVYKCDFDDYYKYNSECIRCPHNDCYKPFQGTLVCDLDKLRGSHNSKLIPHLKLSLLKQLTHCTILVGKLDILDTSFKDITVADLYKHLGNVQEIIGDLYIYVNRKDLTNLTFFKNLKEIRKMESADSVNPGLRVFSKYIEYLGLVNLQHIYGNVNLWLTTKKTCYDNTIPWGKFVTGQYPKKNKKCDGKCHPLCINGCWGPTNQMCYNCAYLKADNYCVKQCNNAPGFYESKEKIPIGSKNYSERYRPGIFCRKCHNLCLNYCTGPKPSQCNGLCKYAVQNGTCVRNCSLEFMPVWNKKRNLTVCTRCDQACYIGEGLKLQKLTSACSGLSSKLGAGGCKMCEKIIIKQNKITGNVTKQVFCHKGECPRGFHQSSIVSDPRVKLEVQCTQCHKHCDTCTGPDNHKKMCTTCNGYWNKDFCVKTCPPNVQNITETLPIGSNCLQCHPQCKTTCQYANDNSSCTFCRHKKVWVTRIKKFVCVEKCPAHKTYTQSVGEETVCLTLKETQVYRQKKILIYTAIGSISFLIVLFIIIAISCKWRFHQNEIKAELKALYSNYKEPNYKSVKNDKDYAPPNMSRLKMIPLSSLVFDPNSKPLGSGAFGQVFFGQWKVVADNKRIYKIDVVIKKIHHCTKSTNDEFLEEAKIMASVSHRYCLPLVGVCLSLDKPCLISTFAKEGSLEKYLLKNKDRITSSSMLLWAEQIADGMAYLNFRGIIHRDLAARNILVCNETMVQITDFGLARLMETTEQEIKVVSGRVPIRWLALETLLNSTYSSATDVWAYGVTLWEIFTYAERPYKDVDTRDIRQYLQEGNRLYQPDICTLEIYMVMVKCWLEDPTCRLTFKELIKIFEKFSKNSKRYLCLANESVPQSPEIDINSPGDCVSLSTLGRSNGITQAAIEANFVHNQYHPGNSTRKFNFSESRDSYLDQIQTRDNNYTDYPDSVRYSPCNTLTNNNAANNVGRGTPEWDSLLPRKQSHKRKKKSRIGFLNKLTNNDNNTSKDNKKKATRTPSNNDNSTKSSNHDSQSLLTENEAYRNKQIASCDLLLNTSFYDKQKKMPITKSASQSPRNPRIESLRTSEHTKKAPSDISSMSSVQIVDSNHNTNHNHPAPNTAIYPGFQRSHQSQPQPIFIDDANHKIDIDPLKSLMTDSILSRHKSDPNSLDSGNIHPFEGEDPSAPGHSRIQSQGYYNVTPSPSAFQLKPPVDLAATPTPDPNMFNNDNNTPPVIPPKVPPRQEHNNLEVNDYLEPINKIV